MQEKIPFFIAIFSSLFLFFVSLNVSWQESTTMDEQAHIPAAYSYVRYLDMRLNPEHPPLIKILAGIPLLFLDISFPIETSDWKTAFNAQWSLGNTFLHENNAQQITFLARIPIIFIATLLGLSLFYWIAKRFGPWAGAGAIVLFAFNPNVLAHSHYVTTDIGIATGIFFSLIFFLRFLKKPTSKNIFFFGLVLGITQIIKFSACILYPFFVAILLLFISSHSTISSFKAFFSSFWIHFRSYGLKLFFAFIISLLPIALVYTIFTWNMPIEKVLELTRAQLPDSGIAGFLKTIILFIANIPILSVFSEYLLGLAMVFVRVTGGNTHYFLGVVSNTANPLYFPTVYVLKETLGVLLLLASGLGAYSFMLIRSFSSFSLRSTLLYTQKNIDLISFFLFVVFYAYLSITGNLTIGLRHLFPIFPFLYILAISSLVFIYRTILPHYPSLTFSFKLFSSIIFLWIILTPIMHYPSYLSYYNELVGGPKNGYLYVTDSNYDWGQDLKNLKLWVDTYNSCVQVKCMWNKTCPKECPTLTKTPPNKEKIEEIRIDYFGGSNPEYWFEETFISWHADSTPQEGWYAISAMFLMESTYKVNPPGTIDYKWLKDITPIGRAGDSIFIYYIEKEDLPQSSS